MAKLAIRGHETRGKEVIEILEMLGGKNPSKHVADCIYMYFYIGSDTGNISYDWITCPNNLINVTILTLEHFLEKFPYKVGDKVYYDNKICDVIEMLWNSNLNTISYGICDGKSKNLAIVEELKPFKEETMEETKKDIDYHPTDYLKFVDNDDTWADEVELNLGNSYEIQIRDGKTYLVKKQFQYPKTYGECLHVKGAEVVQIELIDKLRQLINARNAYWKIAGEQMGLGKAWKPIDEDTFSIFYDRIENEVNKQDGYNGANSTLEFPTEEMRDTFYENFKELIEGVKELL